MGGSLGEIFFKGGWVMWPLLVFSVLCWAVVLERTYVYLTLRPKLRRLAESLIQSLASGDRSAARQICLTQKPEIAEIFLGALAENKTRDQAERLTDRSRSRMMAYLRKNLWVLGTIGSASPFIGLLGTVLGIVRAFQDMAEHGAGGFSVVAGGISEALIATAAGLIVAIIALLTYNTFVTAANQTIHGLRLTQEELLDFNHDKASTGGA